MPMSLISDIDFIIVEFPDIQVQDVSGDLVRTSKFALYLDE